MTFYRLWHKKAKLCGKYQDKLVDKKTPMQVHQITTSKTHIVVQMLNRLKEHALKTTQKPPVTSEWHSSAAEQTTHPLVFALSSTRHTLISTLPVLSGTKQNRCPTAERGEQNRIKHHPSMIVKYRKHFTIRFSSETRVNALGGMN